MCLAGGSRVRWRTAQQGGFSLRFFHARLSQRARFKASAFARPLSGGRASCRPSAAPRRSRSQCPCVHVRRARVRGESKASRRVASAHGRGKTHGRRGRLRMARATCAPGELLVADVQVGIGLGVGAGSGGQRAQTLGAVSGRAHNLLLVVVLGVEHHVAGKQRTPRRGDHGDGPPLVHFRWQAQARRISAARACCAGGCGRARAVAAATAAAVAPRKQGGARPARTDFLLIASAAHVPLAHRLGAGRQAAHRKRHTR